MLYDSENKNNYKKITYFENGKIKDIKEYNNKLLNCAIHYNEDGTYRGKETCLYDEQGLSEVKIYNEKDELSIIEDCVKKEKRDNSGNIVSGPIFYPDSDMYIMSDYIIDSLINDFNTDTLRLLDEKTVMRTISKFGNGVVSDNPDDHNLLLKIKSNPDKEIVKEQLDIITNALKKAIKNKYGRKYSTEIAQKFDNMLAELYSENITPARLNEIEDGLIKENMLAKGMSFINEVNTDIPNGIIDKVS